MSFKIPCGGFRLDEESFSLDENGVLSVSGSGGSDFVVNFSTADMQTWTCDKTLAEITEAVNGGKNVVGSVMGAKVDFIDISPNGAAIFGKVIPDMVTLMSYHFMVFEDEVVATLATIQMTAMGS